MKTTVLGVVFDFDGVIADTETLHLRAYQETLRGTTLTLDRDAYYERYLGYDDVGVLSTVAGDQGITLTSDEISRLVSTKCRHFDELLGHEKVLFPGAAECIGRLSAMVPLAIASGALHQEIEDILSSTSLRHHFEVIVGADDVTRAKPEPDAYEAAVRHLHGADPPEWHRYVAIEDSRWGLESARAAGLRRIGITHTYPAATLGPADIVVNQLSEIDTTLLERLYADAPSPATSDGANGVST